MAVSPESLQILTANSVNIAIPVIFISNAINSLSIEALLAILFSTSIIPEILVATSKKINTLITDTFGTKSGEYAVSLSTLKSKLTSKFGGNYYGW